VRRFTGAYADHALLENISLPGGEHTAWFSTWTGPAGLTLAGTFLMLLFPDGRLPSRRWRIVAWTALLGAVSLALEQAFKPGPLFAYHWVENPFGWVGVIGGTYTTYEFLAALDVLGMSLLAASTLGALFSLILRLRHAGEQMNASSSNGSCSPLCRQLSASASSYFKRWSTPSP
jgi:hypothetical protein